MSKVYIENKDGIRREVPEGTRGWAIVLHDAGHLVCCNHPVIGWTGPENPHEQERLDIVWHIYVDPPQPIVLQPGTPEYRKYLAVDQMAECLDEVLGHYNDDEHGYRIIEAALAAYRGEGGS